jgi:PAS domain S-box-containing protein
MKNTITTTLTKTGELLYSSVFRIPLSPEEERKRITLASLLLLSILTMVPFSILHFLQDHFARSLIIFLIIVVQTISLLSLRYLKNAFIVFRVNVALLGSYFLFLAIIGGPHGSRLLWMFIFPLFAFFLLNKSEALLWTSIIFSLVVVFFIDPQSIIGTYPYEPEMKVRFLITYGIIVLMSYIFESTRQRYEHVIRGEQREIHERAQIEETLRRSTQEKEIILKSLMELVVYQDTEMKIIWANQAACKSAGLNHEELVGRYCYEVWERCSEPWLDCPVKKAMTVGKPQEIEMATPDGRVWNIRGYPVWNDRGHIIGGIEVTLEITARKQAEEALQEAYDIISKSPAVVFLWKNADGWPVEFVSDNVESLFGYSAQEFASGEILYSQTVYSDDLARVSAEVTTFSQEQGRERFTHEPYRIVTKSGTIKWVDDRTYIKRDIEGRLTHYQGIVEDITERKQIEEAFKKSETYLKSVLMTTPIGIGLVCDREIHWINEYMTNLLGYSGDELIGKSARIVYENDEEFERVEKIKYGQITQQGIGEAETRLKHKAGRLINVYVRSTAIDQSDLSKGVIFTAQDITERKQIEEERERLIGELKAKNVELEKFTYTVSHDLKSPIVTIQGFLGFLEQDVAKGDTERLQTDARRIREAANTMQQLVNNLLELSRIGRLINPSQSVSFETIVHEALERVAGQIAKRGVQVTIAPDLPTMYGDRFRLVEVVQNLLDNAVKFMGDQPEPHIEIGVEQIARETVYYVRDNGIGIDPRYQENVFGLFERLQPEIEGTGVGLALIKRIIEVHGGRIWVESEGPGHGSTFYFTVPQQKDSV